ncbi:hypothetical protein L7F22_039459 [Adiantum nelumboides]|nr:hypothetical protein [Adiantum nelumboides]
MPSSPSASSSSTKKSKSRSSSSGSRKDQGQLNANEKRIWQLIQRQNGQTISNEKIQNVFSDMDVNDLQKSINSLLSKSLLSAQQDHNGGLQFIAFSKSEASTMGQLDHDESIIFSFIRVAGNEGIWTKQLKLRANLHQTVMQRCLKSLESKGLIKAVKSVKFPTRKIYMLSSLTPSVELSGGPWYTDNELDTVFIDQLCTVLYQFIASKTWPGKRGESRDPSDRPIYPASHINSLPTASTCLQFLKKSNITDTDLQVENVQSLLDVLVYDGKVEKIPHFRRGGNDDDDEWTSKGKRDGYSDESSEGSDVGSSDDESSDEDGSSSESNLSEDDRRKRKRKSSKSSRRSSSKSKSGKSSRHSSRDREDKKKKEKRKRKNDSSSKSIPLRSDSEDSEEDEDDDEDVAMSAAPSAGSVFVYRAIRQIRLDTGWIEVPCAHCPVFDFCSAGGPVNAEACLYMRDWIKRCANMRAKEIAQNEILDGEVTTNGTNGNHVNGTIEYDDNYGEEEDDTIGADISLNAPDENEEDEYGGQEV